MGYDARRTDISRTPVTLVRIPQTWCANTFGVAPCTGTGEPCYNTLHTCKSKTEYVQTTRVDVFSSANAAVPFPGPRPLVLSVAYLPTEITDNVTVTGRIKVTFADEPDTDVGVDPYVTQRAAFPNIPGTFWRKRLARNPAYKGQLMEILEGFLGDPLEEFRQTAVAPLELITISKSSVTVSSVDLLKGLGEIETPKKLAIKTLGEVAAESTEIILADTFDVPLLPATGEVRIDDEIIAYSGFDKPQRRLYNLTRGARGTVPSEHAVQVPVQICRYFPLGNPFDHLKEILLKDAGYPPALVDSAAFDYWRDWPGMEVPMTAFLSEPTKLSDLYLGRKGKTALSGTSGPPDSFGLVDLLDCKSWVGEGLQITIARNIPNAPGRSYRAISDAANVVASSTSVDMHESSRVTRVILYWDKVVLGKDDEPSSYGRRDIGVNADAEREYGDIVEERIFCRWLKRDVMQEEVLDTFISDLLLRRLFGRQDASPVITLTTELKDSDIVTGQYVVFTTDELLNLDGTPVTTRFQVIKRDFNGGKPQLKIQRIPVRRCAFYAPEEATDYVIASVADQEYGGFYSDEKLGKMPNGDEGFYYY
jgi:hypothetical protein